MTRVAVIGHVEWAIFVGIDHLPDAGGLAGGEPLGEHAGGGAVVAAATLAELGAETELFCALGDDERGHAAHAELVARGIVVHAVWHPPPTRLALAVLDGAGERTILTVGPRRAPAGADHLPWARLDACDGAFLTAGDAATLRRARAARRLVLTPRAADQPGGLPPVVDVDALVLSAADAAEVAWARPWTPHATHVVVTEGADGGAWRGESEGRWSAAPPPPTVRDAYGCGDAFAAALTFGLAAGESMTAATALAARAGASMLGRVGAP